MPSSSSLSCVDGSTSSSVSLAMVGFLVSFARRPREAVRVFLVCTLTLGEAVGCTFDFGGALVCTFVLGGAVPRESFDGLGIINGAIIRSDHSLLIVGITSVGKSTVRSVRVTAALVQRVAALGLDLRSGLNSQTGFGLCYCQMCTVTSELQSALPVIECLWCTSAPTVVQWLWCTPNIYQVLCTRDNS